MSGTLSKVASAASADPVFSLEHCRDLDREIRTNDPDEFPRLTDADFQRLRNELNCIASGKRAQLAVGETRTATKRVQHFEAIEEASLKLLGLLSVDPQSANWDVPVEHLLEGGAFDDPSIDYESLIRGLRALSVRSQQAAELLAQATAEQLSNDEKHRLPRKRVIDYRLYDDLGSVYQLYWGKGSLPVSKNDPKGGPAVRYLSSAIEKITGKKPKAQQVFDAILTIRSNKIDLSEAYSPFTPHGGRRI